MKMAKKQLSMVFLGTFLGNSCSYAVDLNYENLSFLEEPIATHIGDTTIQLNGLVDGALDLESGADTGAVLTTLFQIGAETQLANSLTIGGAYFGEYVSSDDDRYDDNVAAFVRGIWGTVSLGDVTSMINEETRRQRGAGNADLGFDQQLGELADKGVSYIGRFGPSKYGFTIDEDGGFSVGTTFQRPLGNTDYRFSANYRDSSFETNDGSRLLDSQGVSFVAGLTYGSSIFDVELGFEKLSSGPIDIDRKYLSLGASKKIGVWSFSVAGHVGDIEGQDEVSYALGASYDIARGISLNIGVNHNDTQVNVDGVSLLDEDETKALISFRYRF